MSALIESLRPLLRVAPAGTYLLDKPPDEVLVLGAQRGVWLTVKYAPVDGSPDRYSVFEWGHGHIADLLASHVCASGWELRTLIDQIFRKAPPHVAG